MSIRQNKNKAVKHQNQIRDFIRLGFSELTKVEDVESRPMNNAGSDIILSPLVKEIFPFYIECKWYEDKTWRYSAKHIYKDLEEKSLKTSLIPLLIRKKNFSKNQFFAPLDAILNIHSRILLESKLINYPSTNDVLILSNPSHIFISSRDNFIQFDEINFFKIMSCLMKSFSQ
ncbi:hypothetical protein GW932_02785 [archaeon]|nr:hypothetical protein [archaeon]